LGYVPFKVVHCKIRGGPGVCTPFLKTSFMLDNQAEYWEKRLDQYQEYLDNAHTLKGLYDLYLVTERAYRPYVIAYLHQEYRYDPEQFDRGGWWEFLIDLWEDGEAIHGQKEHHFAYLFNLLPTTKAITRELPKGKFTIYRGGHPDGDSWTLSRDKAQWFANMRCRDKQYGGKVAEKIITKEEALFYTNGRNEQEVLLKTILNKHTW